MVGLPVVALGLCLCLDAEGAGYPCWRGSDGSGASTSGAAVAEKIEDAKLAWVSADPIPAAGWDVTSIACSGGLNNPVVADDRVYLTHYEMSGQVADKDLPDMKECAVNNRHGRLVRPVAFPLDLERCEAFGKMYAERVGRVFREATQPVDYVLSVSHDLSF